MASDLSSNAQSMADAISLTLTHALQSAAASSPPAGAVTDGDGVGWFGLLGWLLLSVINLVSTVLYWVLRIATLNLPRILYTLFSTSWTVTMNATTLMFIMAGVVSAVSWVVRYRILNMYSRLPPEPQRKEPEIDLFPDTHDEGTKSGLTNYLDEFLSAIKIFGYLERPVFHELTRSMQTRKLIAGETINLEEEKGFCIVVDGLVEIFVKSGRNARLSSERPGLDSTDEDDVAPGQQHYQLLTEVRNGAPMSSLFSIMSLFTEDVGLRISHDHSPHMATSNTNVFRQHGSLRGSNAHRASHIPVSMPNSPHLDVAADQGSAISEDDSHMARATVNIPHMSLDASAPSTGRHPHRPGLAHRMTSSSAHPDILARATVDTTIAIIPASAFRRLIRIYPKATSHIVHVILSRFQRVTLSHAFNYLGLTSEVLQTEKSMVKYTTCQLPNVMRGDALTRLKEKFNGEREKIGDDEGSKGIALHNSSATRRRRSSSTTLRKEAMLLAMAKQKSSSTFVSGTHIHDLAAGDTMPGNVARSRPLELGRTGTIGPSMASPLDSLRSSANCVSPLDQRCTNPFDSQKHSRISMGSRESVDEDNIFRASVLECMFKALGLDGGGTASREPESADASPRLVSIDQKRTRALFTSNAFGFMGPFEGSADADTESQTSGSLAVHTPPNLRALAQDMSGEVEIVLFPKNSVLVEQGERNPGLYYVIDGFLDIGTSNSQGPQSLFQVSGSGLFGADQPGSPDDMGTHGSLGHVGLDKRAPSRQSVALIKPGGLAGYIGSVSSYRSFIDVVAKTDVYVGFLPRASLERIVDRYPTVLLTMAKRLTSILPRLILHIDFALEWVQVNAGQVIYHDGDESDAIYIVLNGRLRLVEDKKGGGMTALAEYGQGESVGELEVLTETARSGTLHAIRDTELVKFPRTLFNSLAQEHPNITIKISKIIASRMRAAVDAPSKNGAKEVASGAVNNSRKSTMNLRTVAILPVTAGVPVVEFGNRLMNALAQVGPPNGATSLNQAAILNHLGKHAFNKIGKLRLAQYLADLEEKYGLVVYVAEANAKPADSGPTDTNVNSPWTQTCITQADSILLVGLAEGSPAIGEYERFMLGMKSTARKMLVLLHSERFSRPGLTRSWLGNRMWVNGGHYHVQMAFRTKAMPAHTPSKKLGQALKERVQVLQAEIQKYTSRKMHHMAYYSPDSPYKGDFHRLARRLCGKSIGLVLGGGGARGMSQIGIIRAMEEAGIPIDVIGGTSIGSFVGALYARHADVVPMFGLAKKFAGRMASLWRFALDLTYPSASYTTGHEFNRGIFKTFGNTQIEDFWLEFYCNTTNISKSRAEFHTSGYAWRYIRASMSLAGLLPPLCDEGSMLLDGGYVDNLTVSHMKGLGVDTIFAIDVGALDDDTPQTYGDSLSGLWAFFNRWNPLSSHPNPPTLAEIQGRLAYVSSVDALERAKTMAGCIYMRPPVDEYGTLDFHKFDELYQMGYQFGKDFLQRLRDKGALPLSMEETAVKEAMRRTTAPRRASI